MVFISTCPDAVLRIVGETINVVVTFYVCTVHSTVPYTRPEPEFLNIQWRPKSQLFEESCLFKGQSVQQGSQLFVLLVKTILCEQFFLTVNIKIR